MRRALLLTAWTLGSLASLVLVICLAVLIAGNTSGGRALIERASARLSGGHLLITGLGGSLPDHIRIGRLQLSDKQGIWLTAEGISLDWSATALLARHVAVESLEIATLDVERRPLTDSSEGNNPRLPRVDLRRLQVQHLILGPGLAGSRTTLTVQGVAHLVSLEDANGTLRARRTDDRGGEYDLTLRFDPQRMDATLRVEEPAGGALENLLQYPDFGGLSIQADLTGPRTAEHIVVHAKAGQLRASVLGQVNLPTKSADLSYFVEAPSMTPRPGLTWRSVSLKGRWAGSIRSASADAQLSIEALELPGEAAVAGVQATLHAANGALSVQANATGLVVPGPKPRLLAADPLRLAATIGLDVPGRPVQLIAEHRLFALEGHAVTSGEPRIDFTLRLPDVAPFAAMASTPLRGRSVLKGTLIRKGGAMHLELTADNALKGESGVPGALLAGASNARLGVTLTDGALEIERLDFKGRGLAVTVSGAATRGGTGGESALKALRARYEVTAPNLALLSASLAGSATLKGDIAGPWGALATQAQLTAVMSVRGAPRAPLEASIEARGLPALTRATVSARGTLVDAPVELDASLQRLGDGAYHLVAQRAQWRSARADGDLTTGADLMPGHGSLRLRVDRLADFQPLVGMRLEGSLDGSLTLKPARGGTDAEVRLDAHNVAAGGAVVNAQLQAAGRSNALEVRLSAEAPELGGKAAAVDAAGRVNLDARDLQLSHLEAHYMEQTVRLLSPARLEFADGLALHGLRLGLQQALLEVDGRISPELALKARIQHVDAGLVNTFLPGVLAHGTLEGQAELQGTASAPTGVVQAQATGLRFASSGARDLQALSVRASLRLQGDSGELDAHMDAGSKVQIALTGAVPVGAAHDLGLKVTGKVDAAFANALLEARGERAAGTLTVDASVTGPMPEPQIAGTLDLANGDLRDYTQGIHIGNINGHLTGSQGAIRIVSLTGQAGTGQISVTGTVGVLQPHLPVELHVTAGNAQPVASDVLTANLDARLNVRGTLRERLDVTGTLDLKRTVIGIPNAMPPEVAVLDVRRPGEAPTPPAAHALVVGLDVRLHAPREVLVQGRGLNAELGGDLHVQGTTNAPRVEGGFDLIRGTFDLASTRLNFTKGQVSFAGTGLKNKVDPTLDFTAQSSTSDATATLRITGFADAPQFSLESSPPLPQDEILARLLFGESASQLTPLQLAQIGAAVASLGGVGGGGTNPLARVQKSLGLDRLSVGSGPPTATGQSSGTTVEAGRYVSERVFVGVKHSTSGYSQVEADVDLTKHLKLQTQLGDASGIATTQGITPENDPGNRVGLKYEFEY